MVGETDYEKMAERHTKALVESMKQTIEEHKTAINSIPSAVGLGGYFNSLTNVEKTNQDIIALLSARREELKVNTEK